MNRLKSSLTLCGLLVATHGSAIAEVNTSYGTFSGDINLFHKTQDNRGAADMAYTTLFAGLKFETNDYNGLRAGFAVRHGSELDEENPGDSDEGVNTLVTEAYASYQNDKVKLVLGRQAIDLEWVADFHEAFTVSTTQLPYTELTAGYTQAFAVADEDELADNFTDVGGDGGFFLDAKISPMENLTLNPYYLNVDDVFSGAGFKADYEYPAGIGITAHYAASDVDVAGESDGSIGHLELRGAFGAVALKAGYITTDDTAGAGHLNDLGDNINPFEDGNQVYVANADTYYLGAEYAYGKLTLGALFGQTDYAANAEESELNLTAAYDLADIAENLSISFVYADVDGNTLAEEYQKYKLMLSYGF